ncbi:aryl-alcohol dehydrogenase [Mycena polygramma]|nr:aryl-alcohol dehydrogenase [Mycena polygramma]
MPPATNLGRYRQLAPRAAVHVSPLAFGTLTLGDGDKKVPADVGKESAFKLLDTFFDADDGRSEQLIGEWAEARGNRDQLVIATKYTFPWRRGDESFNRHELYLGNNVKWMKLSVQASLKKLRTTYIDIFYLHFWDLHSSVEEIMDSLHILVITGKVLYLGISGSPAWFVVKANDYAKANGKTPSSTGSSTARCTLGQRSHHIIRFILQTDLKTGIALTVFAFSVAAVSGATPRVTGEKGRMMPSASWERSEDDKKMCAALEVVAAQVGAKNITAVAIAYTMHNAPFVHPIIGGRNTEQLLANIEALDITLTDAQLAYIDSILPFEKGYPNNFVSYSPSSGRIRRLSGNYPAVLAHYSTFDPQPLLRPIATASK